MTELPRNKRSDAPEKWIDGADASQMTPDQIAEAQRLAREWKPKAER